MKEKQEKCISKKNIVILSTTAIIINIVILYLWGYEKLNTFDSILSIFIFVCNIILIYLFKYFNAFLLNIIHLCMSLGLFMSLFVDNYIFILLLLCVVIECQLVWIYTKKCPLFVAGYDWGFDIYAKFSALFWTAFLSYKLGLKSNNNVFK